MQRHPDGQADRVRGAADDFRCAAADVQCGGYYRGGAVQRKPVSGGGGIYHGADRNFHEPIYRHFSGSQCAGGPVLRGGSGPGDVGDGSYIHFGGAAQRCGHGICGRGNGPVGAGSDGDA